MSSYKYYAVKIGRMPGIYRSWEDAEEQIKNFPNAKYKSFNSLEEADKFMFGTENSGGSDLSVNANNNDFRETESINKDEVAAFTIGRYSLLEDGIKKASYGLIILTHDNKYQFSSVVNLIIDKSHNYIGEVEAVKIAVNWAIEHEKKSIIIYYSYDGIKKWITKDWKSNNKFLIEYVKFYNEKSKLIKIVFEKNLGLRNNKNYSEAEKLAKDVLLRKGYKTYDDGSIYFNGISSKAWIDIIKLINNEILSDNRNISNESIKCEISNDNNSFTKLKITRLNDKVIINCYDDNKSYLQGKQSFLFQKIVTYAIEELNDGNKVIEVLNNYHALTIKKKEVENAFSVYLPDFPINNFDEKIRNTLLSATYNSLLTGYMPDYTCLLMPILRAYEYYLHRILHDKLGNNTTDQNGKNNFSYFDKDSSTIVYHYNANHGCLSQSQIDYLNDLYNNYNKIRHPYSHWPENSIDAHVITDITVSRNLIIDNLKFFNKFYLIFI